MKKKNILWAALTVAVLIAVAAVMMVIGRGHTVYFDNKKFEYEGTAYDYANRENVSVNGAVVAKLSKKERGMATCMGQSFTFSTEHIANKGDDPVTYTFTLKLPYGWDGIVVNLPGLIAGLPAEACMSEFVPAPVVEEEEEDLPTGEDEFGLGGDV